MPSLDAVFVPGGMPSHTYVEREKHALETALSAEMSEGYKIVTIAGPTKSGKTVLCKRIIPPDKSIWISGGQVISNEDIWLQLARGLGLADEETQSLTASIKFVFGVKSGPEGSIGGSSTRKFVGQPVSVILQALRSSTVTVVVDDFHFVPESVQTHFIRAVKSEIFAGLRIVLIAVPHRAFDAVSAEKEMDGRFSHISIPAWSEEDLAKIPTVGFASLNMAVDSETIQEFAREAIGNPLLVQRFCSKLCANYGISATLDGMREFRPGDELKYTIYSRVAQQSGVLSFERLSRGPNSKIKRKPRKTRKDGNVIDIYEAVLRGISLTGPKPNISYDELRECLYAILTDDDVPRKREIASALGHMTSIARRQPDTDSPALEWTRNSLHLYDPFLMFYLRWAYRAKLQE